MAHSNKPPRTLEGKLYLLCVLSSRNKTTAPKRSCKAHVERIETEAKSTAISVQCDLKSPTAPQQIVAATVKAFGDSIDILVNHAATLTEQRIAETSPEDFDDIFHTNARAPLLMLQAVLPRLRAPGGRIINISNVDTHSASPGD
ncbi:hypothetical protein LTR53_003835 [Teratosphaeriaceae sp. CCFEE 6253]|nr:hypothetical protein LTR53_003835 [Teratosphaeriaceae sp. CCFEE 6253]